MRLGQRFTLPPYLNRHPDDELRVPSWQEVFLLLSLSGNFQNLFIPLGMVGPPRFELGTCCTPSKRFSLPIRGDFTEAQEIFQLRKSVKEQIRTSRLVAFGCT